MTDRYDKPLEVIQLEDGRTVYRTARPTADSPSPDDVTIVTNEQDRFDIIAQNVYGRSSDWWRIAAANGKVNGSLTLPVGTTLVIPRK
jgi:nucleoid-associated protein YgaU